ncbi:MAG: PmoA family protein, partial [Saprospiraceae bacterium]|nr:PmoA family protein [Saprospiraceae bacterium]
MKRLLTYVILLTCLSSCGENQNKSVDTSSTPSSFQLKESGDLIQVFQKDGDIALVTQNAKEDLRPYLHPILAPNSSASLTQFSPGHHKHQTGLYWGFTRVNGTGADEATLKEWFYKPDKPAEIKSQIGRDFFHHPEGSHWKKVKSAILVAEGAQVKWQTVYQMLDESQKPILEETQTWTFSQREDKHLLSLEWQGKALI